MSKQSTLGGRQNLIVDLRSPTGSNTALLPLEKMGRKDLAIIQLILMGDSVVDWGQLVFDNRNEVDHFLRLHQIDFNDPCDQAFLYRILKEAVDYLRSQFHYRVADAVAEPYEIQDLFLYASGRHPVHPRRFQKIACVVLKVMHVILQMEGRDLLFRTSIAPSVVHRLVDHRIMTCARDLMKKPSPVIEFTGSVKTQHSIVTKLLAKQETVAAEVFDKVRYRIVTQEKADTLSVLEYLTRNLFPFNLVVPSQTENTLIDLAEIIDKHHFLREHVSHLPLPLRRKPNRRILTGNPFSSSNYQALNFVVSLPVRIDAYLSPDDHRLSRQRIVFSWVELQILDRDTAEKNEQGDSNHEKYKQRQRSRVLRRLSKGLVVPRKE